MRPVGREPAEEIKMTLRIPQQLVEVPCAAVVRARTRDAPGLLLRRRCRVSGRGCRDLVGTPDARIVPVEATERVVHAEEVVVRVATVDAEFERIVLTLDERRDLSGRRLSRRELIFRLTLARVGDQISLVARR